jgi:protein phosphatase
LRREHNEDAILAGRHIWAVADGMGGHAAGEVASEIVIGSLAEADCLDNLKPAVIPEAVEEANQRILRYAIAQPEAAGLGSTVAGLARVNVGGAEHWAVFNVGDSRVYRYYGGTLSRVTVDHSEIAELIQAGRITEEESRLHASRNVITRSIGTSPSPLVDLWILPCTSGERFVICSDGLSNELEDPEIAEILRREANPDDAAQRLLEGALARGGHDNVSMVVVDFLDLGEPEVDESTLPRLKGDA